MFLSTVGRTFTATALPKAPSPPGLSTPAAQPTAMATTKDSGKTPIATP